MLQINHFEFLCLFGWQVNRIMDGQSISLLNIAISFAAGILSFLSPCVLPLVPGYISLISGVSIDGLKEGTSNRRAVIINSLAFNAGLSVIFLILGTTAGLVGAAITSNPWVRIIGGIVIIAFGLQLIGLLKISALYKDTRFFSDDKPRGMFGLRSIGNGLRRRLDSVHWSNTRRHHRPGSHERWLAQWPGAFRVLFRRTGSAVSSDRPGY